ncbi:HEPN domain-containing protein [Sulfitobacter sp. D35]|uniref:HEPN domain-containing protein n=1 Tax=Sulfitobacter sp. D35 TaxID=3083252 RepID=UPI00296F9D4B|nr:HEPN domain-containing protein [Sulfitobacter sp. D35]MDW4499546.1 HEPN domain-containing protein [Sulfitobacter sp. D35]
MGSVVKPFTVFEKTTQRAIDLINYHKSGTNLTEGDDLVRGAVVISVAGFDRHFTAKFCDVLVPHLKEGKAPSSEICKLLNDAGLDTRFALELAVSRRPFRKIRTIVQNSLSRHTTHRSDAIDSLFLHFGLKNLSKSAEAKANRKSLVKRIMKLVDIRNEIAHEAHVDVSGNAKSIDAEDTLKRINDILLFVTNCDQIIDNRFGIKQPVSA